MPDLRIPCDTVPRIAEPIDDPTLLALDAALAEDAITRDLSSDLDDLEPAAGDEVPA